MDIPSDFQYSTLWIKFENSLTEALSVRDIKGKRCYNFTENKHKHIWTSKSYPSKHNLTYKYTELENGTEGNWHIYRMLSVP